MSQQGAQLKQQLSLRRRAVVDYESVVGDENDGWDTESAASSVHPIPIPVKALPRSNGFLGAYDGIRTRLAAQLSGSTPRHDSIPSPSSSATITPQHTSSEASPPPPPPPPKYPPPAPSNYPRQTLRRVQRALPERTYTPSIPSNNSDSVDETESNVDYPTETEPDWEDEDDEDFSHGKAHGRLRSSSTAWTYSDVSEALPAGGLRPCRHPFERKMVRVVSSNGRRAPSICHRCWAEFLGILPHVTGSASDTELGVIAPPPS